MLSHCALGFQPKPDTAANLFGLGNTVSFLDASQTGHQFIVDGKRKELPDAW